MLTARLTHLWAALVFFWSASVHAEPLELLVFGVSAEGGNEALAEGLTDVLALELAKFDSIEVTNINDIRADLRATAMEQMLGCPEEECVIDVDLGAQWQKLVFGRLFPVDDGLALTVNVLDRSENRVIARSYQRIYGDDEKLLAAVQASATNVVGALQGSGERAVSVATVEALRVARAERNWDLFATVGTTLYIQDGNDGLVTAPGLTIRAGADFNLSENFQIGGALIVDSVESTRERTALLGDLGNGTVSVNRERGDAQVRTFAAAVRGTFRRAYGLVLPHASVGLGVAFLDLDLGREVLEPVDPDETLASQPNAFTTDRSDPSGVGLYAEAGGGVSFLFTRSLALYLDTRIWRAFHGLSYEAEIEGTSERFEEEIDDFTGLAVQAGVLWQF